MYQGALPMSDLINSDGDDDCNGDIDSNKLKSGKWNELKC